MGGEANQENLGGQRVMGIRTEKASHLRGLPSGGGLARRGVERVLCPEDSRLVLRPLPSPPGAPVPRPLAARAAAVSALSCARLFYRLASFDIIPGSLFGFRNDLVILKSCGFA